MDRAESIREQIPTQDRTPKVRESIERVGISGLKTPLRLCTSGGVETCFLADTDLFIDLDTERKGIHMSRLVESINDVIQRGSRTPKDSFERVGRDILSELLKRHKYKRGQLTMRTTIMMRKHTPATNKPTDEPYDIEVGVIFGDNTFRKSLSVKAIGSTLCPHSLETTGGRAHVQRAELTLSIESSIEENILLEELAEICDKSFSAPTYTVLKTVDEAALVEEMFGNPKFVEDVARDCLRMTKALRFKGHVTIRAVSLESIHKHNAISEIERTFN